MSESEAGGSGAGGSAGGGSVVPPLPKINGAASVRTGAGSVTERSRGKFGTRHGTGIGGVKQDKAARAHEASRASLLGNPMSKDGLESMERQIGEIELASEANMNRQLAEMQLHQLAEQDKLASQLRKHYDLVRQQVNKRAEDLAAVKHELAQVQRSMNYKSGPDVELVRVSHEVEERLTKTRDRWEDAQRNRDVYEFMTTRLKNQTNTIHIILKELTAQLDSAEEEHQAAMLAAHANKQERARAESVAAQLKKKLEDGRASRAQKMGALNASIAHEQRKAAIQIEKDARRMEIARLAQGDLQEEEEDRLKQLFLVRRAYCSMLSRRVEDEERKTDEFDTAFTRMKGATGAATVDQIIEKFNNRDATFADLHKQLAAARDRIAMLTDERRRLHELIDKHEYTGIEDRENRGLYQKRDDFDRRLAESRRIAQETKLRGHRMELIVEDARTCVAKLIEQVQTDFMVLGGSRPPSGGDMLRLAAKRTLKPTVEVERGEDGKNRVSVNNLGRAMTLVDNKMGDLMTMLAVLFENEDQRFGHKDHEDEMDGIIRPVTPATLKEVLSVVQQLKVNGPRGQLSNYPSAMSISSVDVHQTPDTLAALRTTMSSLAQKAAQRVYRNIMAMKVDQTTRNVRVRAEFDHKKALRDAAQGLPIDNEIALMRRLPVSASEPNMAGAGGDRPVVSPIDVMESEDESSEEDDFDEDGMEKHSDVVERHKIKRLSAMMSDKRTRKANRKGRRKRRGSEDW